MTDIGEIINSGAFDKLADIMHKLAGPMSEEIGLLIADKVKVYRLKNWINVVKKTEKILLEANLPPNAVPPRIFLPILEASSVENDATLQDLWAGLLASASHESDLLSPSFIETLRQLTPNEAKALSSLFDFAKTKRGFSLVGPNLIHILFPKDMSVLTFRFTTETFERLGLIRRRYDIQQRRKPVTHGLVVDGGQVSAPSPTIWPVTIGGLGDPPELTYEFEFTEYGVQFVKACQGPTTDAREEKRGMSA